MLEEATLEKRANKECLLQRYLQVCQSTVWDIEEDLRKTHSDNQRHVPVTIPDGMPPIQPPEHQLDTRPLIWRGVETTIKHARSASAPGPNGILYRRYKNTPGILKYLRYNAFFPCHFH